MSDSESETASEAMEQLAIVVAEDKPPKSPKKDKRKKKEKKSKKEKKDKSADTDTGAKPNAPPPKDVDDVELPFKAWMHPPKKHKIDGATITVKVPEKTDCWRKTRHNFIMDNAPFVRTSIAFRCGFILSTIDSFLLFVPLTHF